MKDPNTMEAPCQCEECGEWFDLLDGGRHPVKKIVICEQCIDRIEEEEMKREEFEEAVQAYKDAKIDLKYTSETLKKLGYVSESAGWISPKKQLPPQNKSVLVFIPQEDNHVTTGMWDVSKKWVLLDDYRVPNCEVTYWREIDFDLPEDKSFIPATTTEEQENTSSIIHNLQKRIFELERLQNK